MLGCVLGAVLAAAGPSAADQWLPHPPDAKWQYQWSDSSYNPQGTVENVVVQAQQGPNFTLAWADPNDQAPASGQGLICPSSGTPDIGTMKFTDTNSGLVNTDWNSCPPPSQLPILCSYATNCPNSIASALYNVIWGARAPVISEPLLQGVSWNATGGAGGAGGAPDVSTTSTVQGQQLVKVPAFPAGVMAEVVRTNVLQVGAIGDPYGSGERTTWWVDGVGPVRVVFAHAGGGTSSDPNPVTTVQLLSTNQVASRPPPDQNWLPLTRGLTNRYRWTNSRHLPQPEVETVTVSNAVNQSAALAVKSVSGPMRVVGQYLFSSRLSGLANLQGSASAATLVTFPALAHHRHFLTPVDLMVYGFNPVLPAYPQPGSRWSSGNRADFAAYGVTGTTRIVGIRTVRVPAGRFRALEVRSVLTQKGHRFGSGVRTCWFAAGRGLVKLVFKHRDGSTSVVQLLR